MIRRMTTTRLDPQKLITMLPIMPYHAVADIGCGSGHVTLPLGKYVDTVGYT